MHTGLEYDKETHKFSVIHRSPSTIKPVISQNHKEEHVSVNKKNGISRRELPWNTESISPSPLWQSLLIFRPSYQTPQRRIFKFKTPEAFLFRPHQSFISLHGEFKLLVSKYKHHWIQMGDVGGGRFSSSPVLIYLFVCLPVFIFSLDYALSTRVVRFITQATNRCVC